MGEGCGASRSVVEEYPFGVRAAPVTAVQLNLIAPSPAAAVSVGDAKSSEDSVWQDALSVWRERKMSAAVFRNRVFFFTIAPALNLSDRRIQANNGDYLKFFSKR